MRTNPLPNDFASKLMPADANGFLLNRNNLQTYIEVVLQYLQDARQNLSTSDFVDVLIDSLDLDLDSVSANIVLPTALNNALILKCHPLATAQDEIIVDNIKNWLLEQASDYKTYSRYLCILTADFPMPSTLNPKKIAVWRNTSKMGDWERRQAISVRKWIGSTFKEFTDDQAEDLAKRIDGILNPLAAFDVRHHDSYDFDGWERAYTGDKIRSCMHPDSDCDVGIYRTFTCYCSGYHGLPDNGLSLTVLYQDDDEPVARAITFTLNEQKHYIRVYGDDRLYKWLNHNGYEQADFAEDTILYTTADLMKPYVDGYVHMADRCTTNGGKHYWKLCTAGDYDLQTTDAYASAPVECECCGNDYHTADTQEVRSAIDEEYYNVCDNCYDENRYYVYTGGSDAELLFFHDGYTPDTNSGYVRYDGQYYTTESLYEYNLVQIDDEVYHEDDLYYCEVTDEYFVDSDDVYTGAEQISTDRPVHFPYYCISKDYWDNNVVECACGTLALSYDTREISTPSLGSVITLDDYWAVYCRYNGAGVEVTGTIFKLDDIERDYDYDPTEKMQAFRDYAIAYNTIQSLRFQELGI